MSAPSIAKDDGENLHRASIGTVDHDRILRALDNASRDAFRQISDKNYSKPYLGRGKPVFEVAVAVYGTSDVMIRYREAKLS
jgi:hypothetical protein